MEKNAFLSNSKLDMLYETLVELDQELVSIVNRYRQGMKYVYTHKATTCQCCVFCVLLCLLCFLSFNDCPFFRDRTEDGNFSTT